MFRLPVLFVFATTLATPVAVGSVPRSSTMEPAAGTLATGVPVLVDDGTCPTGLSKQVTGGDTKGGVARVRRCVPR